MANTENIEAKLCAYVDGELDAAGRAEIEAHLAANPQHRQLIEALRAQPDLLRDLPRAKAPDDLLETVHSQLERSALLDGGHTPGTAGRISPWPRIMSVAAVLAMAIGLFAVIYYVMKQNNPNGGNRQYATGVMRTPTSTLPGATERSLSATTRPGDTLGVLTDNGGVVQDKDLAKEKIAEADRLRKLDDADGTAATTQVDVFARGGAAGAVGNVGGLVDSKSGTAGAPTTFTNMFADAETEEKIKRSGDAVPSDSLVMVVASADPSQAQGQVQQYLDNNKIRWESVTEPVPQMDLTDTQTLNGSRLGSTQMRLKSAPPAGEPKYAAKGGGGGTSVVGGGNTIGGGKAGAGNLDFAKSPDQKQQPEPVQQMQQTRQPQDDLALRKDATVELQQQKEQIALAPGAAPPPNPGTPNTASNAIQPPVYDLPSVATSAPAQQQQPTAKMEQNASNTTAEQHASKNAAEQKQQDQLKQQITLDMQQPPPPPGLNAQNQTGAAGGQALIVARGLTRRQVSDLNSSLATQNAGRVYNYRRSGDNFTPAPALGPTPSPATQPAPVVATAAPMTPAAPAAPVTPAAAAGAIATQPLAPARESVAISSARPTISGGTVTGAGRKPDGETLDFMKKTNEPASRALAMPTTLPATVTTTAPSGVAATRPADERLDVVICIQPPAPIVAPNAAPPNAAAPTLMPATPATQPISAPNAGVSPAETPTTEPAAPNATPPSDSQ